MGLRLTVSVVATAVGAGVVGAAPEQQPWPTDAPMSPAATACAGVSGVYAVADSGSDTVEIRDVRGLLGHTITRADIQALIPWHALDAGGDGPCGLALSDSGRSLFVLVSDDTAAPDAGPSDAILRYDMFLGTLSLFARTELAAPGAAPLLSCAHFRGRLYVGTASGAVEMYRAERADQQGVLLGGATLAGSVRGLAVDRDRGMLYGATESAVLRADLSQGLAFSPVGTMTGIRALAHSDHYGGPFTTGLFALTADGAGSTVHRIPDSQALGSATFAPSTYHTTPSQRRDLAPSACGRLLTCDPSGATMLGDTGDFRLGFEQWLTDEFGQVVTFARALVAPDAEPAGWVIDADVSAGGTRFHPATPDGAGWVTLALLMNDHLFGDPGARDEVLAILERYAGVASDGIGPSTSADGHIRHWLDPATGGAKPGWNDEFATLSTMKIVLGAARAHEYYAGDEPVRAAARSIIERVEEWDRYIQRFSDALYLVVEPSGIPAPGTAAIPFNEGIIYVEQAARYGGASSQDAYGRWLDRTLWPTAEFVPGMPVTGAVQGGHQAAFLSLYPFLVTPAFRDSPEWQEQVRNLLASNAAWTDDHGPRYFTVFSAGTTKAEWGSYNADSLSNHPGDVTTFPSLMAFCADGRTAPAVSAYHAYRHGARQLFQGVPGAQASLLYRRSDVDQSYAPNSAGLPDVVLGALGLAELISPGAVDQVLARAYPSLGCAPDFAAPFGVLDFFDVLAFLGLFDDEHPDADLGAPFGVFDFFDVLAFLDLFSAGCP